MKEKGQIFQSFASDFFILAKGPSYGLSNFRNDFTPFFKFEGP